MGVAERVAVNRLPDGVGELRVTLGQLARGDHAMQERLHERVVDAEVDAKLAGAVHELLVRQGLRPVVQDTGHARQVGVDAIVRAQPLGREPYRERVAKAPWLGRELDGEVGLVAGDGRELVG